MKKLQATFMKHKALKNIFIILASIVLALLLNYCFTSKVLNMLGLFDLQVYIPANIMQMLLMYEIINFFIRGWNQTDKVIVTILYIVVAVLGLFYRRSLGDYRYDMNPFSFINNILSDYHAIFLSFLNILLFVPLPMVICFYRRKQNHIFISFILFALTIEVSQIVTKRGIFDIGDIVLYLIGYLIGLRIFKLLKPKLNVNKT